MAERLDDVDPLAGLQDVEFDGDSGVVSSKGSGLNGTKLRHFWDESTLWERSIELDSARSPLLRINLWEFRGY